MCLLFVKMRHQCRFMNTQLRTKTEKRDNIRLLYCSSARIPPLLIENGFISILTHGFSKTHPPQFLNSKYVCITTYNYYSILLPLHLSIYYVWCSRTKNLVSLSIEKYAYTCIFIRKMCLHIHFYSKIGLTHTFLFPYFFKITPTELQTKIFWSFKFLLWSFIYVYWNEASKRFFQMKRNCS